MAVDAKSSRKTRIRINVTAGAPSDNDADEAVAVDAPKDRKKPAKRKRDTDQNNGDESAEADISASSIPKKRKKISGQASKQKKGSKITATPTESSDDNRPLHKIGSKQNQVAAPDEGSDDPKPIYLDIQYWKKCRESLDGTYKAARKNLRQHNGWELPPGVPHDMFADVAIYTLDKMKK